MNHNELDKAIIRILRQEEWTSADPPGKQADAIIQEVDGHVKDLRTQLEKATAELERVRGQRNKLAHRGNHAMYCPGPAGLPCSCGIDAILQEIAQEKAGEEG